MKEKESGKPEAGPPVAEFGSKARKYFLYTEFLKTMMKQKAERRQSRRFPVHRELMEVNGRPGGGAKILDLSASGARLYLPFTQPQLSLITFKFALEDQGQVFRVVGRVIWSREAPTKNWHYVGIQFFQNYWEIEQWLHRAAAQAP
jgi:hypothetical protein